MRTVAVAALVAVVLAGSASAQVGTQLIVTMNLAGPVKLTGGSYYIAFTIDDSILTGPQSDSSNWTHYVLYRQGRFFFGRVPPAPFRPFGFEAIKPPTPYPYGEVSPDQKSLRVRVALADLHTGPPLPLKIKVNFVTVDENLRSIDALGSGAGDRFGFVTLDLRKDTFLTIIDPTGDAPDPSFDITGGSIQLTTP
ncbi:MAG: hypothetical protein E6H01_10165 [Bacillati bacterium ANGP1]|uniref:Uncharacterized protein n=1 Tax=Candidatus Segetimicrobium genomatis TaxID=2569760 RepID=A0A537KWM4_9BACT|nr:MAG: hypothetical protein E6H01_10165 [Terrabacteria group bacterium ANGP1]